ncbi:MAG: hypothetical protein JO353_12140 [Phycisphaerae bacterium]|nr:hypothetical protein [Phycisphaerae bacterium]
MGEEAPDVHPGLLALTWRSAIRGVIAASGLTSVAVISRSGVAEAFAAVIAITIALPLLMLPNQPSKSRLLIGGTTFFSVSLVLLLMPVTFATWAACVAILCAQALLMIGLISTLREPTIVVVASLLWLSWPVWLSVHLAGHEQWATSLAAVHPLLAINGQLLDQAIWTERPLMYGWTALNQDVPYAIPTTIVTCVAFNGILAVLLIACPILAGPLVSRVFRPHGPQAGRLK